MTETRGEYQIEVSNKIESVLVQGDLSMLSAEERVQYYRAVCQSVGLNPLTRPFDYITLNGKLVLYANKSATDQLRDINGVSVGKPDIKFEDDWIVVSVEVHDKNGRSDADVGVVSKRDMRGDFGNAVMKAVTKAKRRATLSICGLGMLDETEIETIPDAQVTVVNESGEIEQPSPKKLTAKSGKDVLANNGHTRPFEPEVLRAKMAELVTYYQGKIDAGETSSKESDEFVITSHIEQVWAGDKDAEQKRHAVTFYLIEKKSVKDFSDAEKLAFKHWLKITKDDSGEWVHCKEAGIEAVAVYRQAQLDAGQIGLDLPAEGTGG